MLTKGISRENICVHRRISQLIELKQQQEETKLGKMSRRSGGPSAQQPPRMSYQGGKKTTKN